MPSIVLYPWLKQQWIIWSVLTCFWALQTAEVSSGFLPCLIWFILSFLIPLRCLQVTSFWGSHHSYHLTMCTDTKTWHTDWDATLVVDPLIQPIIAFLFWLRFWFHVVEIADYTVNCHWIEGQWTPHRYPFMWTGLKRVLLSDVVTKHMGQDKQIIKYPYYTSLQ